MQILKSILDQTILIWRDSTGAARVGIIMLLLICVAAIIGVGIWSAQPSYALLESELPPNKIQQLVESLDQRNIKHRLSGTSISVDERDYNEARQVLLNLGIRGSMDSVAEDSTGFWPDPRRAKQMDLRNLQARLENSIREYQLVDDVNVHLNVPDPGPFARRTQRSSASIMLTLVKSAYLEDAQAATIAKMVARAVPGLESENVVITDNLGTTYSIGEEFQNRSSQEQFRVETERFLAKKAEELLTPSLGIGNAIVRVNTSFEFPDEHITAETFDVENKVNTRETITNNAQKNGRGDPSGAAGVQGNVTSNGNLTATSSDMTQESIEKTTEVPRTTTEKRNTTPRLLGMTVSVLVNSKQIKDSEKGIPDTVKNQYTDIIKHAIGFDEKRGDQISLEFFPFVDLMPIDETATAPFPWEQVHMILKNISLGLAGLVALLVGMMAFKKITPAPTTTGPSTVNRDSQIKQLGELVKQNPEVFSRIVAAWSGTLSDKAEGQDATSEARSAA